MALIPPVRFWQQLRLAGTQMLACVSFLHSTNDYWITAALKIMSLASVCKLVHSDFIRLQVPFDSSKSECKA